MANPFYPERPKTGAEQSRFHEIAKEKRDAQNVPEQEVNFSSEPGAIEIALQSGNLNISELTPDAFVDPYSVDAFTPTISEPGKTTKIKRLNIDEARVENLALAFANAEVDGAEVPEVARPYFERAVQELLDSGELDAPQTEKMEIFLNQLENGRTMKAEALREAEKHTKPELTDQELVDRAAELGFSELQGINIDSLKSEIDTDRTDLVQKYGMTASEVDKVAAGSIKPGFFGRARGLLWGKYAHKNKAMERLARNTSTMNDFESMKQIVSFADAPQMEGKRNSRAETKRVRANMEKRDEKLKKASNF